MRELEFLPAWYPDWRRRRRMVALEVWMIVALGLGLGLQAHLAGRNASRERQTLASLDGQLRETRTQLEKIDRLEVLRRQMRRQEEVLNRLGVRVEAARLIEKLSEALPREVSLVGLTVETEESPLPVSALARTAGKDAAGSGMDRRLKVRLQGVAPTDVELATFLTELNKVPFFEKVAPTYARDRHESGHLLREFELVFSVNLNLPAGS